MDEEKKKEGTMNEDTGSKKGEIKAGPKKDDMSSDEKKKEETKKDDTEKVKSEEVKKETKPEEKDEEITSYDDHKKEHHNAHATHHKHHVHHHNPNKTNTWKIVSAVLAILVIILFYMNQKASPGDSVESLTADQASEKAVDYIKANLLQPGMDLNVTGVEELAGIYSIKMDIAGQEFESFVTKDGSMLFPSGFNMDEKLDVPEQKPEPATPKAPAGLTKSDKPVVELFVMSHCPYGTQSEKGIIPVAKLLGDKIDFKIHFVYYSMHGKAELDEQLTQYCIQKEQNDKYFDYLWCFLEKSESETCQDEAGIDKDALATCVAATDEKFNVTGQYDDQSTWLNGRFPRFDTSKELNEKYGVGGSPTLVINGAQVSSARSPAAYLATICGAFNEPPAECEESLPATTPSTGFGFGEADSAIQASCS